MSVVQLKKKIHSHGSKEEAGHILLHLAMVEYHGLPLTHEWNNFTKKQTNKQTKITISIKQTKNNNKKSYTAGEKKKL